RQRGSQINGPTARPAAAVSTTPEHRGAKVEREVHQPLQQSPSTLPTTPKYRRRRCYRHHRTALQPACWSQGKRLAGRSSCGGCGGCRCGGGGGVGCNVGIVLQRRYRLFGGGGS
ncbi:unnamed protein product, partial [Ectocarpus sp. 8 AP-2014]